VKRARTRQGTLSHRHVGDCDAGAAAVTVRARAMLEVPAAGRVGLPYAAPLGSHGIVQIEFKRDGRDEACKLIDINVPVCTCHGIGARAGVRG
jgi:hypothetical protein